MKAARQRAIVVREMAHHLDAGAPAEPRQVVRIIQPATDDQAAVDRVVSILAELLARRRKR